MSRYKLLIGSIFTIIFSFALFSCDNGEDLQNPIAESLGSDVSDQEFISLDLDMNIEKLNTTRCSSRLGNDNPFDSQDYCLEEYRQQQHPFGFKLILLIDDKVVSNDSLLISLGVNRGTQLPDLSHNPYITYVKQVDNTSLKFGLRFLKTIKPNQVKLLCLGSTNGLEEQFQNCDIGNSLSDIVLRTKDLQLHCDFISLHKLSDETDWNKIDKKIILKRNAAQIIVLYPDPALDFTKIKQQHNSTYWYIFTVPNTSTSLPNYTPSTGYRDFDTSFYYFKDNTVRRFDDNRVFGDQISLWGGSNAITYKNKTFGYFYPLDMLAPNEPFYPVNGKNEKFQYLTFVAYDYHNREKYWSNIQFPQTGIKANTRYVIILNENTQLWTNHQGSNTRSEIVEDVVDNHITSANDYELLEFDMNEELPFELIE